MTIKKQIKKIKFHLYLIFIITLINIGSIGLYFRFSNYVQTANNQKISTLISEVGSLKEQNEILNNQLQSTSFDNQLNSETIKNLYLNFQKEIQNQKDLQSNIVNYQNYLDNERKNLIDNKNTLNQKLNNQNTELNKIKNENKINEQLNQVSENLDLYLILGINQNLTDSIQIIIVNQEKQKITLLSLPRDLYVEGRKINEYYKLYGIDVLKDKIQEITGLKLNKYAVIDFSTFYQIIDLIGGIEINVINPIKDTSYPTNDGNFKTVTFEKGIQRLNSSKALEYARSRSSSSDFERSKRQQEIMVGIKQKFETLDLLNNLNIYISTLQIITNQIDTNINLFDGLDKYKAYRHFAISAGNILSNENFLYPSKNITGQYILLPKNGNFIDFKNKILEII